MLYFIVYLSSSCSLYGRHLLSSYDNHLYQAYTQSRTHIQRLILLLYAGYSRVGSRQPDTIVLRGVPSRWFAEPRVSSKPSMLVTHTIFSAFGKIRYVLVVWFHYIS